jgi:hypothetical protein
MEIVWEEAIYHMHAGLGIRRQGKNRIGTIYQLDDFMIGSSNLIIT